jgi:hypothetical protein
VTVRNVEAAMDEILAEYATTFCLRPVRRHEVRSDDDSDRGSVMWSIEQQTMVELVHTQTGPDLIRVHEIGLVRQLKNQLRSGRVKVEYVLKN